jgi:hypothetical protein
MSTRMIRQRGVTLPELLFALWGVILLAGCGALVYAVFHFASKFW